ncbi:MAG: tRNA uridine-5-carboxymethylaminomethyl(34) synthesis GTPase MnmE [Spirochaetaceae bacterium]|jgi:tRNA modification GTPase|nr:tRNA uridine-5-carboxymethylaminomethyl(34) synthesis GTPase MnmE [Spirochaetaceae bacterium]
MKKNTYGADDPIAARATPAGESALAVVRTSGAGSIALLSRIFSRPDALNAAAGNTVVHGWITNTAHRGKPEMTAKPLIDDVLVSVYRAPRSFTGEEGADISCHGGSAASRAVMSTLRSAGFRDALPGEFSFRAFMNGKIDLTRAESIMEIVSAKTDRGREHAVGRLAGALERKIRDINTCLVETLAQIELFLDYPEDEIDGVQDTEEMLSPVRAPLICLRALAAAWRRERLYQEGALVVIAGRPNAGKSSLFNFFLREERSIVTDIPGTTRDWIEAALSLEGIPVRFADTAGLRDSASGTNPPDPAERIGIERSRGLIARADIVLYLLDGSAGITGEDREFAGIDTVSAPVLFVWNKADIARVPEGAAELLCGGPLHEISAKTGAGVEELCAEIVRLLEGAGETAEPSAAAPGTVRQKELIDEAAASVADALARAGRNEPLDLVAPALRDAINALGEITGDVSTADILETMFSRFCVGK